MNSLSACCSHKLPLTNIKETSSRQDARMLFHNLDQTLPDGAIGAKYRLAAGDAEEAQRLYSNILKIRHDFAVVDVTQRECARLFAVECLERAHVLEKVGA
jgi:hypothetical protein